jgi:hypothetical protein
MGINDNDGTLDKSLGTNQLVIGSIVGNIKDTNLACANLGTPSKVSRLQLESTELLVSSSATNFVDTWLTDLGHSWGATQFELALFAELGTTSSCFATLMASFTCNTLELRKRRKSS